MVLPTKNKPPPYPYIERSEAKSRHLTVENHTSITTSIQNKRMRII